MKLLKLIFFVVLVYFIRRFVQMYRAMKHMQISEEKMKSQFQEQNPANSKSDNAVEVDYKILD